MLMAQSQGHIEIITGPMFSGKTEELIRRVKRASIAKQKVQIFKPALDTRYSETKIISHSSLSVISTPLKKASEVFEHLHPTTRVVAFDEVQFFDSKVIEIIEKLADMGLRVICAGLDLDFKARPFPIMPHLLCIADEVQKIHAICTVCGAQATRSQRLSTTLSQEQVELGSQESYEARCRAHYTHPDLQHLEKATSLEMPAINPKPQ